ncbi:unnamed protein product [Gongylonema pulchrum]|uniref:Phosphomevalonate kinase n=1 Tax=Gongylonema pulchrum TaxID=637853 RepID=A0A183E3W8_9BILA|nr:unnamed protein product [Gongylonema pulchrum]
MKKRRLPVVICVSGKRRSGKDFLANLLADRLKHRGCYEVLICGISYPLKEEYAELNGMDAERLKFDASFKEHHRADMVRWGEEIRANDPDYFCRCDLEISIRSAVTC